MPGDHELLLDTHRGCERSARTLWAVHAPRLLAFARALVGPHDAEDVVQSVFCGLLDLPRRRLSEVRDVPAFLAATTRRAALNSLRSARRQRARHESSKTPPSAPRAPANDGLQQAIDSLPRRWREVLVLKHVAGLTFDQMGVALALPRDTAASRYRAALAALRTMLKHDQDTEADTTEVAHAL